MCYSYIVSYIVGMVTSGWLSVVSSLLGAAWNLEDDEENVTAASGSTDGAPFGYTSGGLYYSTAIHLQTLQTLVRIDCIFTAMEKHMIAIAIHAWRVYKWWKKVGFVLICNYWTKPTKKFTLYVLFYFLCFLKPHTLMLFLTGKWGGKHFSIRDREEAKVTILFNIIYVGYKKVDSFCMPSLTWSQDHSKP